MPIREREQIETLIPVSHRETQVVSRLLGVQDGEFGRNVYKLPALFGSDVFLCAQGLTVDEMFIALFLRSSHRLSLIHI